MENAKPFVKWAGGKRRLLSKLESMLPIDFSSNPDVTYVEPFVGGGAMLFHMLKNHKNIRRVVINDMNRDLIQCYRLIKDNPDELIERLSLIEDNFYSITLAARAELYYAYREQYNHADINPNERAALFVFLNRTCFNGLYRVNSKGKFNVPFGKYKKPIICNREIIYSDHKLLNSVEVKILNPGDYKRVLQHRSVKGRNFFYFDPPYRPLLNESNFKEYSNSPFGDKEQEELKKLCDKLHQKGDWIMLSNSDSKNEKRESYFESLYDEYNFSLVLAPRCINAFPDKRSRLTEVLIRNYK